jgi:hypothetical protein
MQSLESFLHTGIVWWQVSIDRRFVIFGSVLHLERGQRLSPHGQVYERPMPGGLTGSAVQRHCWIRSPWPGTKAAPRHQVPPQS